MADREPDVPNDRPNGDMTDPRRAQRTDHAAHDTHVIAAAVDRTADERTRHTAELQMAECHDCASLFADLRAISSGLGELPRSIPVTRDFRITPERAAKLRPRGWRRFLDGFSRTPSLRPFASALTTLGVAGLVLTIALPSLGLFGGLAGGAAPAALENTDRTAGSGAPAAQAPGDGKANPSQDATVDFGSGSGEAGSGAESSPVAVLGPTATRDTTSPGGGAGDTASESTGQQRGLAAEPAFDPLSLLPWASLALVVLGVALLWLTRSGARDRS